jgi:hypothetical protein
MKIAFLIIAHKNKPQIELLINQLQHPSFKTYLHLDKNANFHYSDINASFIPITNNYACSWGGYNVLKATFALLKKAHQDKNDYFILISGQDFPIKSNEFILNFFLQNKGKSFINIISEQDVKTEPLVDYNNFLNRFSLVHVPKIHPQNNLEKIRVYLLTRIRYLQRKHSFLRLSLPKNIYAGENWFNLYKDDVSELLTEYRKSRLLRLRLCLGLSMEEILPHTLLKRNLKNNNWVNDSLRFTIWKPDTSHPEYLSTENINEAISSDELFARKFENEEVINLLAEKLNANSF